MSKRVERGSRDLLFEVEEPSISRERWKLENSNMDICKRVLSLKLKPVLDFQLFCLYFVKSI